METTMEREEYLERVRHALLAQLEAAAPASVTVGFLTRGLRLAGFPAGPEEARRELEYLAEKGFARREAKAVSPAVTRYALSAAGRDYLVAEGLA